MLARIDKKYKYFDFDVQELEYLETANYVLHFTAQEGFYLEKTNDFELPEKIYGNLDELSKRYLDTYSKRPGNLGILLKGLKGTGKSILAKKICIDAQLPVIIVGNPYTGPAFTSFLEKINQPVIILMDEFEKIYRGYTPDGDEDVGSQEGLLSILDGVYTSSKIFILTANDEYKIANALYNRPGRIHYVRNYVGVEPEVVEEIVDDLLVNKSHKADLLARLNIIGKLNLDLIISVIEEMNRYNDTPKNVISLLNISPEDTTYKVVFESIVEFRTNGGEGVSVLESFPVPLYTEVEDPFDRNTIDIYGRVGNEGQKKIEDTYKKHGFVDEQGRPINTKDGTNLYHHLNNTSYEDISLGSCELTIGSKGELEFYHKDQDLTFTFTPVKKVNITNAYAF